VEPPKRRFPLYSGTLYSGTPKEKVPPLQRNPQTLYSGTPKEKVPPLQWNPQREGEATFPLYSGTPEERDQGL
jgi:hypothetical protein